MSENSFNVANHQITSPTTSTYGPVESFEENLEVLTKAKNQHIINSKTGTGVLMPSSISQSEHELQLIKNYLLLPIVLDMLQDNIRYLSMSSMLKFRSIYENYTQSIMDRITADLVEIRRELRKANIKIYEEEQSGGCLSCKYICRGYQSEFTMLREHVRADISVMMRKYL